MRNFNQSPTTIKKLALILLGSASLGLTACNGGSNTPNTTASTNTTNNAAKQTTLQSTQYPNLHIDSMPQPTVVVPPVVKYDLTKNTIGNIYSIGTSLKVGEAFKLDNGTNGFMLLLQEDHNLRLFKCDDRSCNGGGTIVWETNTTGQGTDDIHLDIQDDGNLVLYSASGKVDPLWAATWDGGQLGQAKVDAKPYGVHALFAADGNFTMWLTDMPSDQWYVWDIQKPSNQMLWSTNISPDAPLYTLQTKITNATSCPITINGYGNNKITINPGAVGNANIINQGSVTIDEMASTSNTNDCSHPVATTTVIIAKGNTAHLATVTASQSPLTESTTTTPYTATFSLNGGHAVTLSSADSDAGTQHSYDQLDYSQHNQIDLTVGGKGTVPLPPKSYPSKGTLHITNNTGCTMITNFGTGYVPADGKEYTFTTNEGNSTITEAADLGYLGNNGQFVKTNNCSNITTANVVITPGSDIAVTQTTYQNYAVSSYGGQGLPPHSYLSIVPTGYGSAFTTPDSSNTLYSDRSNQKASYAFTSEGQKDAPEFSLTFNQTKTHSDMEATPPVNQHYMVLKIQNDTPMHTNYPYNALTLATDGGYTIFAAGDGNDRPLDSGYHSASDSVWSWGTQSASGVHYSQGLVDLLNSGNGMIPTNQLQMDGYAEVTANPNYQKDTWNCLSDFNFMGGYNYEVHMNTQGTSTEKNPSASCTVLVSPSVKIVNADRMQHLSLVQGDKVITTADDESLQHGVSRYELIMQKDGNLVIYADKTDGSQKSLWDSGTTNPGQPVYAVFDNTYGAIRVTGTDWRSDEDPDPSSSANGPYTISLQTDGNLVIYNKNGSRVWASDTDHKF